MVCACAILALYYRPWVQGPGGGIRPSELHETLEGPNQLLSLFKKDSRISRNYRLTPYLAAVPVLSGLAAVTAFLPGPMHWIAAFAGLTAATCSHYLREEVADIPFHQEAPAAGQTERAGFALVAFSLLAGWTRKPKKR